MLYSPDCSLLLLPTSRLQAVKWNLQIKREDTATMAENVEKMVITT